MEQNSPNLEKIEKSLDAIRRELNGIRFALWMLFALGLGVYLGVFA